MLQSRLRAAPGTAKRVQTESPSGSATPPNPGLPCRFRQIGPLTAPYVARIAPFWIELSKRFFPTHPIIIHGIKPKRDDGPWLSKL